MKLFIAVLLGLLMASAMGQPQQQGQQQYPGPYPGQQQYPGQQMPQGQYPYPGQPQPYGGNMNPSTCDGVVCPSGYTCEIIRPRNCRHYPCSNGQCVLTDPDAINTDCTGVNCPVGQTCEVVTPLFCQDEQCTMRAQCVRQLTTATCENSECEDGEECQMKALPYCNYGSCEVPLCINSEAETACNAELVNCPSGQQCSLVPPKDCRNFPCPAQAKCVISDPDALNADCTGVQCPNGEECKVLTPKVCEQQPCQQKAECVRPKPETCEETGCPEGEVCMGRMARCRHRPCPERHECILEGQAFSGGNPCQSAPCDFDEGQECRVNGGVAQCEDQTAEVCSGNLCSGESRQCVARRVCPISDQICDLLVPVCEFVEANPGIVGQIIRNVTGGLVSGSGASPIYLHSLSLVAAASFLLALLPRL